MCGLVGMCSNALCPGNVNVDLIVRLVGQLGYFTKSVQLLCWIQKTFVAAGNIIVHFNAVNMIFGSIANNFFQRDIAMVQSVSADANLMSPILLCLLSG